MKDNELLMHLTHDWKTVNKIRKELNMNWDKILAQLRGLELKGLVDSFEVKQRNNIIRFFRLATLDENKLKVIEKTPFKERGNHDHKYLLQHKYKGNIKKYILEIINEVENGRNEQS